MGFEERLSNVVLRPKKKGKKVETKDRKIKYSTTELTSGNEQYSRAVASLTHTG